MLEQDQKIRTLEIGKQINEATQLQSSGGKIPEDLKNSIIPTLESNPFLTKACDIVVSNVASNSASATIYTTPTDKDFYLTAVECNLIKDASSDSTGSDIRGTIAGATTALISLASLASTAQNIRESLSLTHPVKLDRNTAVLLVNATATANIVLRGTIYGFLMDTTPQKTGSY